MSATAASPPPAVAERTGALLAVGAAAGAFAGLFGVGGGSVIVPLLLAMGLLAHRATAASLLAIAIMAAAGAAVQAGGYGQVDPLAALAVGAPAVGGVILGTALQQRLAERTVATVFAVLLLVVAATMLLGLEPDGDGAAGAGVAGYALLAVVGVVGGVNSGLLGVGGGAVFVPGLVFCLGMDHVEAEATSLLAIIPVSLVGSWRQHRYGNLDVRVGLLLGLGSVPGAVLGVALVNVLPVRLVELLFALLLLHVAWRLLRRRRAAAGAAPTAA